MILFFILLLKLAQNNLIFLFFFQKFLFLFPFFMYNEFNEFWLRTYELKFFFYVLISMTMVVDKIFLCCMTEFTKDDRPRLCKSQIHHWRKLIYVRLSSCLIYSFFYDHCLRGKRFWTKKETTFTREGRMSRSTLGLYLSKIALHENDVVFRCFVYFRISHLRLPRESPKSF